MAPTVALLWKVGACVLNKHQEQRQICGDLGIEYIAQNGAKYNILSSSKGCEVYDEESVMKYNWDSWMKNEEVIRILCCVEIWAMKWIYCSNYPSDNCAMLESILTTLRMKQKITSRTRGMKDGWGLLEDRPRGVRGTELRKVEDFGGARVQGIIGEWGVREWVLSARHQGRVVELIPEKFLRHYMSSASTLDQVG